MTMRTRQVIVAAGLVLLVLYALAAWMGSTAAPAPTPSIGPSPTGAVGPGPATFEPSEEASPLP